MKFLAILGEAAPDIGIGEAVGISLAGYGIVFAVLVTLLLLVMALTAIMNRVDAAKAVTAEGPATAPAAAPAKPAVSAASQAGKVPAPGSMGECDLHTVDDKTAALLMAIVADQMNTPLNELRFLSIKELGEGKS